jgi:hypothetical protein
MPVLGPPKRTAPPKKQEELPPPPPEDFGIPSDEPPVQEEPAIEPPAEDFESEAWKTFMGFYDRIKNVAEANKLIKYALTDRKIPLSDAEREDAGNMLSSMIENLEAKQ